MARTAPGGVESVHEGDPSAAAEGRSHAAGRGADAVAGEDYCFS